MTVATKATAPRTVRMRNLTLLLGSMMTVMAAAVISPALPAIEANFSGNPNAALFSRLTLTMPALIIALAAPLVGFLLDRIGRRPVVLFALFLFGLAGTAGIYLGSLPALLASRALLGISIAGTMSGFTTLIGDFFKGAGLDRFMGLQAMGNSIGGLVFLVLGGWLAELSWHAPFLIYGLGFLVLPLFWRFVNEPESRIQNQSAVVSYPNEKFTINWPIVGMLYVVGFISMLLFYMIPVQLPFGLTSMGISGTYIGLAIGLMALLSAVTAAQYKRLRARFSYATIYSLVFGLMAGGYFIIAYAKNFDLVLLGLLITGVGIGPMMPNTNVWLVNKTPANVRGRLVSGLTSAIFLGQFLSPIVAQPVLERQGTSAVFTISAVLLVVLAVAFFLVAHLLRFSRYSQSK